MTRADFYDWLIAHDCTVIPLDSHRRANVIKVVNKDESGHVFLDLPIDDKPVKDYYVCKACKVWLKIPIPDACKTAENLADQLQDKFYPGSKRGE